MRPLPTGKKPGLDRVLGRRDLVLLFVVAVANLNLIPAVSASRSPTQFTLGAMTSSSPRRKAATASPATAGTHSARATLPPCRR